jgi:hypothetical protein
MNTSRAILETMLIVLRCQRSGNVEPSYSVNTADISSGAVARMIYQCSVAISVTKGDSLRTPRLYPRLLFDSGHVTVLPSGKA